MSDRDIYEILESLDAAQRGVRQLPALFKPTNTSPQLDGAYPGRNATRGYMVGEDQDMGDVFEPGIEKTAEYRQGYTAPTTGSMMPNPYQEGTKSWARWLKGRTDKIGPRSARQGFIKDIPEGEERSLDDMTSMGRAVLYRIANQRPEWFMKYGLDAVKQAIQDVTGSEDDWEEIGSSDVSAYVNYVGDRLRDQMGSREEMQDRKPFAERDLSETSDYARRREREEAIISGKKPARKKAPTQTSDYAKRREQQKKQGVSEGSLQEFRDDDDDSGGGDEGFSGRGSWKLDTRHYDTALDFYSLFDQDYFDDERWIKDPKTGKVVAWEGWRRDRGDTDALGRSIPGKLRKMGGFRWDDVNDTMEDDAPGTGWYYSWSPDWKDIYRQGRDPKDGVAESLQAGEYHLATVTLDDGTTHKVKIRYDEGFREPIERHFRKQGRKVVDIDVDYSVRSDVYEGRDTATEDVLSTMKKKLGDYLQDVATAIKKDPDLIDQIPSDVDQISAVKTIKTDDGHEIKIHGNEDDGFRISIKNQDAKTTFRDLDEATMAVEIYCARRRQQAREADYIDEKTS